MRYENLLEFFQPLLDNPTSIIALHKEAVNCAKLGDMKKVEKLEKLINILHSSDVPHAVQIGTGTTFAYGGFATIVHRASIIGKNYSIGSNVTLGAGPIIGDNVYVATGAKILGRVHVGDFAIIGANAVVTKDVPPFSIVTGANKISGTVTKDNFSKYKAMIGRNLDDIPDFAKYQY